jgi:PAS domain S-box-containing protein
MRRAVQSAGFVVRHATTEDHALNGRFLRADHRLTTILDGIVDGFYALGPDWRFVLFNRGAEAHFGMARDEVLGRSVWDVFPQAVGSEFDERFRAVRESGIPASFVTRSVVVPDTFVEFRVFPLEDGLGVSMRNISEARRAEAIVRDGEARFEVAAKAAGLGVWEWDVATGQMMYSERAKAIHGFAPDARLTFDDVRAATHHADLPHTLAQAKRALDPAIRDRSPYEYRVVRPSDGQVRWVRAFGDAVFVKAADGTEHAIRYVGTIEDVTEHRLAEEALRDSEARLRVAIEAGRMAVWDYDVSTDSVATAPELLRMLGFPDADPPGLDELRSRYFPGDRDRLKQIGRETWERGERFFEAEFRYRRPDDTECWFSLRAELKLNALNFPTRVLGVLIDVTERKRAEERQQLLVNELNHRVKNTLATVQSIASQTLRNAATTQEAQRGFESRLIALSRAHDVLTRENWEGASLYEVVAQAVEPYSNRSEDRLHLSGPYVRLTPRLALALAMALQELATNAVKYGALSTDAGQIRITWSVDQGEAPALHLRWEERGGPPVVPPARRGFGSRLIDRLGDDLNGTVRTEFPATGLVCTVDAPLT